VEALVGYVQTDLVIPSGGWESLAAANAAARAWCAEVNGRVHSEIAAIPAERLATERGVLRPLPSLRASLRQGEARKVDKLCTIRLGSARYSVPRALVGEMVLVRAHEGAVIIDHAGREVARHRPVSPGEVVLEDAHYGGPARRPARAVRPRSAAEVAFLALGPAAGPEAGPCVRKQLLAYTKKGAGVPSSGAGPREAGGAAYSAATSAATWPARSTRLSS